jgi:hypothetical protein
MVGFLIGVIVEQIFDVCRYSMVLSLKCEFFVHDLRKITSKPRQWKKFIASWQCMKEIQNKPCRCERGSFDIRIVCSGCQEQLVLVSTPSPAVDFVDNDHAKSESASTCKVLHHRDLLIVSMRWMNCKSGRGQKKLRATVVARSIDVSRCRPEEGAVRSQVKTQEVSMSMAKTCLSCCYRFKSYSRAD